MTTNKASNERVDATAQRILEGEVIACQSHLVDALLADGRLDGWNWEEVENLWSEPADEDDDPEPQEVYEWWIVTRWLADELRDIGEPVLNNDYGYWWGRTCTGQAVIMDGTLQQVAARLISRVHA